MGGLSYQNEQRCACSNSAAHAATEGKVHVQYPPGTFTVCYGRVGTFVMRQLTPTQSAAHAATEGKETMPVIPETDDETLPAKAKRKPKGTKLHVKRSRRKHPKDVRYPGGHKRSTEEVYDASS